MSQIKLHGVRPQAGYWPGKSDHLLLLSLLNPDDPETAVIGPRYRGMYPNTSMEAGSASIETMVDMGFASTTTVRVKGESDIRFFVQNLCVVKEKVPNPLYETTHSCVKSVSWGIGARLAVAAWSLKGDLRVTDIRDVAIHAQVNDVGSYFEVQTFGTDLEIMKILKPLLAAQASSFKGKAFAQVAKARGELIRFFTDESRHPELIPEPVAAEIDFHRIGHRPGDEPIKHLIASEIYALEMIQQWGHSPSRAIEDKWFSPSHYPKAIVEEAIVRRTYRDLFGLEDDQQPSEDDRKLAQALNTAGR